MTVPPLSRRVRAANEWTGDMAFRLLACHNRSRRGVRRKWQSDLLMKKRLRKKLRLGEFQELGFEVGFRLPGTLDEAQGLQFWDEFIGQAIESAGLMCGGGCGQEWGIFVVRPGRRSATEDDQRHVRAWLERHPLVSDIRVGPLVDAWHSA